MGSVAVVIGYYGDEEVWRPLVERAARSVHGQAGAMEVGSYSTTLARARNAGAFGISADWLIFLDADDELAPGYVEAMLAAAEANPEASIFKPATLGVYEDGSEDEKPVMIEKRNLLKSNHIVIGAMVRREMFTVSGGFRELPALEDWDLWLRLALEFDAKIVEVPDAVYRVHVRDNSRNKDLKAHHDAYLDITRRAYPIAKALGLREL